LERRWTAYPWQEQMRLKDPKLLIVLVLAVTAAVVAAYVFLGSGGSAKPEPGEPGKKPASPKPVAAATYDKPPGIPAASILPAETAALVTLPNVGLLKTQLRKTALKQFFSGTSAKPGAPGGANALAAVLGVIESRTGVPAQGIAKCASGQVALAIVPPEWAAGAFGGQALAAPGPEAGIIDGEVSFALIASVKPSDTVTLLNAMTAAEVKMSDFQAAQVSEKKQDNVSIRSVMTIYTNITYALAGKTFLLGNSEELITALVKAVKSRPKVTLAKSERFIAAEKRIGAHKEAFLRFYVNTDALVKRLPTSTRVKVSGLHLSAFKTICGYASIVGKTLRQRVDILFDPKGPGLARLIAHPNGEKTLLKAVPREAAMCWAARIDVAGTWNQIMQTATAISQPKPNPLVAAVQRVETGREINIARDVLRHLGQEIAVYVIQPEDKGVPLEVAMLMTVKDGKPLVQGIKRLARGELKLPLMPFGAPFGKMAGALSGMQSIRLESKPYKDYTLFELAGPGTGQASVSLAVGPHLILAFGPTGARGTVDRIAAGGPSILDSADFTKATGAVAKENFMISYTDYRRLRQAGGAGAAPSALIEEVGSTALSVATHKEGITIDSTGSVANVGLSAAALPLVATMAPRPKKATCEQNLKQIWVALSAYARSHGGKFPTGGQQVEALLKTHISRRRIHVLFCPDVTKRAQQPLTNRNIGFEFTMLNLTLKSPGNTPVVWDRQENYPNGRHVLFLNGHVDFVSHKAFKALLEGKSIQEKQPTPGLRPSIGPTRGTAPTATTTVIEPPLTGKGTMVIGAPATDM